MKLNIEEKEIVNTAANILYKASAEKEFKNYKDSSLKSDEPLYTKIVSTINNYKENN